MGDDKPKEVLQAKISYLQSLMDDMKSVFL